MDSRIHVTSPLVILHGDEMAQVAFEHILKKFVTARLDIQLEEIDLSAEHRLLTNGKAVIEAIDDLPCDFHQRDACDPTRHVSLHLSRRLRWRRC